MPFDFIIGAIYLPPENSSYVNSNLIDNFNILEREIVKYKNEGKILLCGDFNSRVGNIQDSIQHDSNDPFMPLPINYTPDICVAKRNNLDSLTNAYGRSLIDLCIGSDLCIINGRVSGDHLGNITCVKTKYVFDENSIELFKNSLRSHECVNKLASFCTTAYLNDRDGINTATNDLTDIVKKPLVDHYILCI